MDYKPTQPRNRKHQLGAILSGLLILMFVGVFPFSSRQAFASFHSHLPPAVPISDTEEEETQEEKTSDVRLRREESAHFHHFQLSPRLLHKPSQDRYLLVNHPDHALTALPLQIPLRC